MKIFLSHSSKNKPLVREVKNYLPQHVKTWLDEKEILLGDRIAQTLENVIALQMDYLIIFLDQNAIKSKWVIQELKWALNHEKVIGRNFILPIILEPEFFKSPPPFDLGRRKYLTCYDYNESTIKGLAENITSELFALLSRDLNLSQNRTLTNTSELSTATSQIEISKSSKYFCDLLNTISAGLSGLNVSVASADAIETWQRNLIGMLHDCFRHKQDDVYIIWMRPESNGNNRLSEYKSKNLPKDNSHYYFTKGEGLAGKVWEYGIPAATSKEKPHKWWVYREDCENTSYICCPIGNPKHVGGVLAVGSDKGFHLLEIDIEILEIFSSILSLSI